MRGSSIARSSAKGSSIAGSSAKGSSCEGSDYTPKNLMVGMGKSRSVAQFDPSSAAAVIAFLRHFSIAFHRRIVGVC